MNWASKLELEPATMFPHLDEAVLCLVHQVSLLFIVVDRSTDQMTCAGQLVVFFPTDLFAAPVAKEPATVASPTTSHRFFPLRLTDSFGSLAFGHWATHDDYAETDEALQCATVAPARIVRLISCTATLC